MISAGVISCSSLYVMYFLGQKEIWSLKLLVCLLKVENNVTKVIKHLWNFKQNQLLKLQNLNLLYYWVLKVNGNTIDLLSAHFIQIILVGMWNIFYFDVMMALEKILHYIFQNILLDLHLDRKKSIRKVA